jgi:hypothetical protein
MIATYTCDKYAPADVVSRYVRKEIGTSLYVWVEVGKDARYNVRKGTATAEEIPTDVRQLADDAYTRGVWPSFVLWPITERAS